MLVTVVICFTTLHRSQDTNVNISALKLKFARIVLKELVYPGGLFDSMTNQPFCRVYVI